MFQNTRNSAKIYSTKKYHSMYAVYFRLYIDLMHITPPVTAEGYDGSHYPKYSEWLATSKNQIKPETPLFPRIIL